jgi:hypothetical protein
LKFETPDIMSAVDAQIIEQLKWSDEKICATFHVPGYMVQVGAPPFNNNVEALAQQYYSQCLQIHIESIELCLTKGLEHRAVRSRARHRVSAADGFAAEDGSGDQGRHRRDLHAERSARECSICRRPRAAIKYFLQKQNWPLTELGSDAVTPAPAVPAPGSRHLRRNCPPGKRSITGKCSSS